MCFRFRRKDVPDSGFVLKQKPGYYIWLDMMYI